MVTGSLATSWESRGGNGRINSLPRAHHRGVIDAAFPRGCSVVFKPPKSIKELVKSAGP